MALHRRLRGQDQRRRAVVEPGRIAGGDRAVWREQGLQRGQDLRRCVGPGVLVALERGGLALGVGRLDGHDLLGEEARSLRGRRAGLAPGGEGVLVGAGDLVVAGHVLARLRHGLDAVLRLHRRIDEAPAQARVLQLGGAGEGRLGLAHDVGRPRHGFGAAGDHQVLLARADRPGGRTHGVEARGAQAVDRGPRHGVREAGQQGGHAAYVAVVLARLVGGAQHHLVDGVPVQPRQAGHQRLQRQGRQVVGAQVRERSAEAPDRGADGVADVGGADRFHGTQAVAAGRRPWKASSSRARMAARSIGRGFQ